MAGDTRDYWNQFVATVSWAAPCEVVGVVEALGHMEGQGVVPGLPRRRYPVLQIRLDNGRGVIVNGTQTRLLELLDEQRPGVGDRIKIEYLGEAASAAPGRSPAKEFTLKVQRKGSRPAGGTEVRGSASENVPQDGTK